jgi:O-antigen ligase
MGHADLPPQAVTDDSKPRAPLGQVVAWFLIVLGVIYMTALGGGGFFGLYSVTLRIISVVTLTAALAVWLVLAWRNPFWRPTSSMALALGLSVITLAIALLFSERPRLGADYLAYAALLTGAYLLQQRLFAHAFFGPRLGALAVLLGYALCLVFILRVFSHWLYFWGLVGRLTVPPLRPGFEGLAYGHPGTFATVVILLWLASIAHVGLSTAGARLVVGVLGLMVAFVVVVTSARGAWLGIAVAAGVVAALWLVAPERRASVAALLHSGRVRVTLIASIAAFAVVTVILLPAIVRRLGAGGEDLRAAFFSAAVRMFQADPVTGLGPGMWVVERARYTLPSEQDYYIPHAHNLYLQTVAELGVIGALAGVVVLVALARLVWLGIRSNDALTQRLGWTSLFALVYLAVHQLVDFYPNMAALGFLLALLIARLDALTPVEPPWNGAALPAIRPVFHGRGSVVALGLATVLSFGWLVWSERAALAAQEATNAGNQGDWSTAQEAARRAVAADPGMPPYLFTLGVAAAHEGNLEEARDALQAAAEIDDFPTSWLDVAQLELELGNSRAARDALQRALRIGYQNPQVGYGAMAVYEALGDQDAAVSAAADALEAAPELASDPSWSSSRDREEVFESALNVVLERAEPLISYKVAMEAGRHEQALRLASRIDEDHRAVAEAAVAARFGDEDAFDELHGIAANNPLDSAIVAACRRVATVSHRTDWPYGWTGECTGGGPFESAAIRVTDSVNERATLPGPDATWHNQYVYRRLTPFDELVPGVPHLRSVFGE